MQGTSAIWPTIAQRMHLPPHTGQALRCSERAGSEGRKMEGGGLRLKKPTED